MSIRSALLLAIAVAVLAFAAGRQLAPTSALPQAPPSRSYAPAAGVKLEGVAADARAILLQRDLLGRTADLTALLEKLGPDSLEDLKAAYSTISIDWGDTDLVFFAEWWARFDPAAAFSWTQHQLPTEHPIVVTAVLRTWARTDPVAALLASKVSNQKLRGMFAEACVIGWEESGLPGLLEYVYGLPEGGLQQRAITVLARRKVLRDGPDAAFEWAAGLPDSADVFKMQALRRVASYAAEVDPPTAAKWAESLLGGHFEKGVPQRVGARWVKRDPRAAMEWLATLTPGREREDGVRETFRAWVREDRDAAVEYATTVKLEPWLDPVVARVAQLFVKDDPLLAIEWAGKLADENLRISTTGSVARAWFNWDELPARAWVDQSDLPDHIKQKIFATPERSQEGALKKRRDAVRQELENEAQGDRGRGSGS
ncbi:MAG: hypothetical protein VX466_02315 [Myxococcota bacterium]|nr:hypothetical protein [Myxococcota bacterium]